MAGIERGALNGLDMDSINHVNKPAYRDLRRRRVRGDSGVPIHPSVGSTAVTCSSRKFCHLMGSNSGRRVRLLCWCCGLDDKIEVGAGDCGQQYTSHQTSGESGQWLLSTTTEVPRITRHVEDDVDYVIAYFIYIYL